MNRFLLLTAALATPLVAQNLPDPATLANLSADVFKAHSSVQYVSEIKSDTTMLGPPISTVSTQTYQAISPNKYRMEMKTAGVTLLSIADGESIWTYQPLTKQYSKDSLTNGALAQQLQSVDVNAITAQFLADTKVVRSEVLQVDGQPRDCWVQENHTMPGLPATILTDFLLTLWIDKQHGLPLRTEVSGKFASVPGGGKMQMVTTLRDIRFDEPLAASLFQFTPPADATELPRLMPNATARSEQTAKELAAMAEPPRVEVAPGSPQAFVPRMRHLTRVFPEYPAEPLPSSSVIVSLLVTVDTAGQVSDAEVLTGNPAFRKSALEAIKRARYRPVFRGGVPVYTYTRDTVIFSSMAPGGYKPEQLNMSEERAAAERVRGLTQFFPRTAQQILEDSERDVEGATGLDRDSAVPDIAKAALAARAYDKAAIYAEEMLQREQTRYGYEDAVYYGHYVRGLVALRRDSNLEQAKKDLLDSAATKGSPVLGSFGPNLTLAKELLEKGERATVLEFLERCKSFWKSGQNQLNQWIATLRSGGTPNFASNLNY